jgi:hypothetical protein
MEKLRVPNLSCNAKEVALQEISAALDKTERHAIERIPWPVFSYKPQVSFSIAYAEKAILLKYFVQENAIRALCQTDNSPVHQDSCVEFFIAFDNDEEYYNLEFNCTGACLFGFGKSKTGRQLIDEQVVNKIRRLCVIESYRDGQRNLFDWELTIVIPLEVFVYNKITHLKDRQCKVNFFKCGDKLPEPHFLAWEHVKAASPDFHLPEFFGTMHFI